MPGHGDNQRTVIREFHLWGCMADCGQLPIIGEKVVQLLTRCLRREGVGTGQRTHTRPAHRRARRHVQVAGDHVRPRQRTDRAGQPPQLMPIPAGDERQMGDTVVRQKLLTLGEHHCDFAMLLPAVRAVREQLDWPRIREAAAGNDFAMAFLDLAARLGLENR